MKKIAITLLVIGIIFLSVGGLIFYNHQKFMSAAKLGKGTIIGLEYQPSSDNKGGGTYHPVIAFTDEKGKEHTIHSNSGSNPPAYTEGEKVDVYYNPKDPNDVSLPGFFNQWGAVTMFGGIGFIIGGVGAGILLAGANRKKEIKWLQQFGTAVQADFKGVVLDTTLTVNDRNPFHIWCDWLDTTTNTFYSFRSEHLWFDPTPFTQKKITVWIDPAKPKKKNYMDISFLPKQA